MNVLQMFESKPSLTNKLSTPREQRIISFFTTKTIFETSTLWFEQPRAKLWNEL